MTKTIDAAALPGRPIQVRRPDWRRLALAGLPLASGAALVTYIALKLPMPLGAAFFAAGAVGLWAVVLPRMPSGDRRIVWARVRTGLLAGIPAVIAYDATRYGFVAIASMSFSPFHVFPLFGQAFIGTGAPESITTLVGITYHVTNGLGFAIAFALAIRRPTWWKGIAWALCLEAAMLALYPGWLGMSLDSELVPVSLAGHLSYGAVLGVIAHHREGRR